MKKLSIMILAVCMAVLNVACESDATLDETRVADVTAPAVSLSEVNLQKYTLSATVSLSELGNPAAYEYGLLISTDANPSLMNSSIVVADKGSNQATLTADLAPGTTYYVCGYALTANQLIKSEAKQIKTADHYLGAFLGKRTLTAYNLISKAEESIPVEIVADDENERVAYLVGLSSSQVDLSLAPVKMVFDLEAGTVTIPKGQIAEEKKYGNYAYAILTEEGKIAAEDNIGGIDQGAIKFESLVALIMTGPNAGLSHLVLADISIQ